MRTLLLALSIALTACAPQAPTSGGLKPNDGSERPSKRLYSYWQASTNGEPGDLNFAGLSFSANQLVYISPSTSPSPVCACLIDISGDTDFGKYTLSGCTDKELTNQAACDALNNGEDWWSYHKSANQLTVCRGLSCSDYK